MPQPSTWSPNRFIPSNRPILGAEEIAAVTEVLESGMLTHKSGAGTFTLRFEEAFAKQIGAKHAIAVNSGTAALHAALLAFEVKAGDEVIAPPFSFIATTNMVLLNGAKVVFADITPDTYTLDTEKVEAAITPRTKAIMPVHLYGHPTDMDPLMELAKKQLLREISDKSELSGDEKDLLDKINSLGIGPLGLGGKTTALSVKIDHNNRAPASFFVAVSFFCWAARRGSYED